MNRRFAAHSLACAAALLASGCGDNSSTDDMAPPPADLLPPPPICKMPGAPTGAWFNDVTAAVLPQADDPKSAPTGNTLQAGDLDGDGYPDLISFGGEGFPKKVPASTFGDDGAVDVKACDAMRPCSGGQACTPTTPRDTEGYRRRFVW